MRKNHRFAFLAIGGLGLLAAVAPGLAATLTVPGDGSTRAPAAGQGLVTVQGFTVAEIEWVVDPTTERVTDVNFDILRDSGGSVDDANAVVRVRLEASSENAAWQECSVTAGAVICELETSGTASSISPGIHGAQMFASALERVNIIAFDRSN